ARPARRNNRGLRRGRAYYFPAGVLRFRVTKPGFALTVFIFALAATALAQNTNASADNSNQAVDRLLDQVIRSERAFLERGKQLAPLVETYIQEAPELDAGDPRPVAKDHYFLGRLRVGETLAYEKLVERTDSPPKPGSRLAFHAGAGARLDRLQKTQPLTFLP